MAEQLESSMRLLDVNKVSQPVEDNESRVSSENLSASTPEPEPSKMVTVKVIEEADDDDEEDDTNEKAFTVAKDKITAVSPYFSAAFDGDFWEGVEEYIELRDTNIETFERFLVWLDKRSLSAPKAGAPKPILTFKTNESMEEDTMLDIALYIFADAYDIPVLLNETITRLYNCLSLASWDNTSLFPIAPEDMDIVYARTTEESPIRRLLVDWYCHGFHQNKGRFGVYRKVFDKDTLVQYPSGFLANVVYCTSSCPGAVGLVCDYHDHADKNAAQACGRQQNKEGATNTLFPWALKS